MYKLPNTSAQVKSFPHARQPSPLWVVKSGNLVPAVDVGVAMLTAEVGELSFMTTQPVEPVSVAHRLVLSLFGLAPFIGTSPITELAIARIDPASADEHIAPFLNSDRTDIISLTTILIAAVQNLNNRLTRCEQQHTPP